MTTQNAINTGFPIEATHGGSGVASPTAHGILIAEGASAFTPIVLTNGQMLIGHTGSDPAAATITSTGSTITVTTGAGTLNIDIAAPVTVANGGTGLTSITAHGILVGEGTSAINPIVLTNGQLLIGSTGADPSAASLTAGSGITITPGAGTITIASSESAGGGYTWVDQTTTSVTIAAGTGYIADNAGLVTFTLPLTATIGDSFAIVGKGAGGWTLVENATQLIHFGTAVTTATTGSLSSSNQWDCIEFVCVTTNTTFVVRTSVGNITYV